MKVQKPVIFIELALLFGCCIQQVEFVCWFEMTISRHFISQRTLFMTSFPHSHRSFTILFSLLTVEFNSENSAKRVYPDVHNRPLHKDEYAFYWFLCSAYITNWMDRLFSHQPNNKEDEDGGKSGQQRRYSKHKNERLTTHDPQKRF